MAIAKLTKSGKAVQFVDDEGNVFMCSLGYFKSVLDGNLQFVLLSRLPFKVSDQRFKKSPLLGQAEGAVDGRKPESPSEDSYAMAAKVYAGKHESVSYIDREVL